MGGSLTTAGATATAGVSAEQLATFTAPVAKPDVAGDAGVGVYAPARPTRGSRGEVFVPVPVPDESRSVARARSAILLAVKSAARSTWCTPASKLKLDLVPCSGSCIEARARRG